MKLRTEEAEEAMQQLEEVKLLLIITLKLFTMLPSNAL